MDAKFDPKAWAALTVTECIGLDYKQFTIPAPTAQRSAVSSAEAPASGAAGAGAGATATAVDFPLTLGCGAVLVRLEGEGAVTGYASRVVLHTLTVHGCGHGFMRGNRARQAQRFLRQR